LPKQSPASSHHSSPEARPSTQDSAVLGEPVAAEELSELLEEESDREPVAGGMSPEMEWQQFFVRLAQSVGLPKSIGLLYGHLFLASEPLAFEDLVEQLPLSKGSVSQGLRVLQRLRAIRPVLQADGRRSFYEAETRMRKLVGGFLNETVRPRLEQVEEELEHLSGLLPESSDAELRQRVDNLRRWHFKARRLLPWMVRLTSAPDRSGST